MRKVTISTIANGHIPHWNNNPEWQANQYAAAFLLPRSAVEAAIKTLGLNARALARTFGVSETAMDVRLRVLRIR